MSPDFGFSYFNVGVPPLDLSLRGINNVNI
jgi:hypothetical protein